MVLRFRIICNVIVRVRISVRILTLTLTQILTLILKLILTIDVLPLSTFQSKPQKYFRNLNQVNKLLNFSFPISIRWPDLWVLSSAQTRNAWVAWWRWHILTRVKIAKCFFSHLLCFNFGYEPWSSTQLKFNQQIIKLSICESHTLFEFGCLVPQGPPMQPKLLVGRPAVYFVH